ncbi:MAG: TetR/AcrR family transcriptional regulator [Alphaproteobacteria bacterium]|nr:helix-turn-helix domain-containing protein [Alphaproteobacteria bacterium]TAD91649.1 MAG: TetR/AcrR family transcriptional regulator [Alphaproteobacteria bacterium]
MSDHADTAPVESNDALGVRRRDRAATEARILDAARRILARDGFLGFGVNALAAEAGCDKKLIGRYFTDLDGVLEALGGALGFWLGDVPEVPPKGDYGERMAALFQAYATALRADPVLQQILAWELIQPSAVLQRLETVRSRAVALWMARVRGDTAPPPGVDAPAVNAVLLAALHYLTLRQRTLQGFAGLDLASTEGQARIDDAMLAILRLAYSQERSPT